MAWFKIWDEEWLNKYKNTELDFQGALVRLMCAANLSFDNGRFTHRGTVKLTKEQIIEWTNINERLWLQAVETGFLTQLEGVWLITGWLKVQSEYERKKGYKSSSQKKDTHKDKPEGQVIGTSKGPQLEVKDVKDLKVFKNIKDIKNPKAIKEGKHNEEAHPDLENFVGWYKQEFKTFFNQECYVNNSNDRPAANQLLNTFGFEKAKAITFLGWNSTRKFQQTKSMTLSGLMAVANELVTQIPSSPKENEYDYGETIQV